MTAFHFWNTVPTMLPNARVAIARYSPLMRRVGRPIAAPHSRGEQPGDRQGDQERHALRQQDRVDVGADAEERRVAQADQTGVADQQHQPDAGDGEDEHAAEFTDVEFAQHERDSDQHEPSRPYQNRSPLCRHSAMSWRYWVLNK